MINTFNVPKYLAHELNNNCIVISNKKFARDDFEILTVQYKKEMIIKNTCFPDNVVLSKNLPVSLEKLEISNSLVSNIVFDNVDERAIALKELYLQKNNIVSFTFDTSYLSVLTHLDLSHNNLETFDFPQTLIHINISHNKLQSIKLLPKSLEFLDASYNRLGGIPTIFKTDLKNVNLSHNHISSCTIYDKLENLDLSYNLIKHMPKVTAAHLKLNNCAIRDTLYIRDDDIQTLDVSNNEILQLVIISRSLTNLSITNNTRLWSLPNSVNLKNLDISGSDMKETEINAYKIRYPHIQLVNNPTNSHTHQIKRSIHVNHRLERIEKLREKQQQYGHGYGHEYYNKKYDEVIFKPLPTYDTFNRSPNVIKLVGQIII